MKLNRRQFLLLTGGLVTGCQASNDGGISATKVLGVINAGSVGDYARDGVYSNFRDLGFFVIHRGNQLLALSSICTHRKCKLRAEPDFSFYCKCHGSTFDPAGHVLQGPARRALPVLSSFANEKGELIVMVPAS